MVSFPGMGKFEKEKEECLHNCVCGTYTHVHLYMYVCTVHIYNCMYVCIFRASLVAQLVKNLPAVQETGDGFLGQEDPLEKEMAIHSSILAWEIPWTEETGGLQSMGHKSQSRNSY